MKRGYKMEIRSIFKKDWEDVKEIYEQGIQTGNATFQIESPTKESWFNGHLLNCTLVCEDQEKVIGWTALSPISSRPVYAGVAEISVIAAKMLVERE
jgi:L-amino acid N-acyltransferase YncA